jgi:hypothetical protein
VLNPVRVEVLQLDLVMVKEPAEEGMRERRKPTLVKVREGDNVAIAWRQHLLTAR